MAQDQEYPGVVEKIILDGKHGPYAVARSKDLGLITFSLGRGVWQEEFPEPGMCVMLSRVRRKTAGWRANHCRFVKPSDKQ